MSITINLYYTGKNGNAKAFAEEMEKSGIANRIRAEKGNLRYEYFLPFDNSETVLLIDSWENQKNRLFIIKRSKVFIPQIAFLSSDSVCNASLFHFFGKGNRITDFITRIINIDCNAHFITSLN